MSKTLHRSLEAKMATLKGPEWDSSDEEENVAPVETKKGKKTSTRDMTKKKMSQKKAKKAQTGEDENTEKLEVVYIGHLPGEFEERDLRTFLMQFGKVRNIRISRSVKTGRTRGFAFVKFSDAPTAKIVSETLQGYFLGERRLVCHLVPNPHRRMFYDTDKVIARRKLRQELERKQRNRDTLTSMPKMKEITVRLVAREKKKRNKLAEMGIEYEFPGYAANQVSDDEEEEKEPVVVETSAKKNKRKDSVSSETTSPKKTKRKDSVGSESSASKKKRKDSVGSEATSSTKEQNDPVARATPTRKSKRTNSKASVEEPVTPSNKKPAKKAVQSDKKKTKASKNRRTSAP